MKDIIQKFSPEEYISLLTPTTQSAIQTLFNTIDDPQFIAIRLADIPLEGISAKGGVQKTKDLYYKVVQEMKVLFCTDDPKYADVRSQLQGEASTTARVVLYLINSAVASHINMAAALCVPLVAILLAVISKVGLSIWCSSINANS